MFSHPDNRTVSDWIDGKLSEEEASEMERYLEEHPEVMSDAMIDDEILRQLSEEEPDEELTQVIARVKSGLATEALAPAADTWKQILSPSTEPDSLGRLGDFEIAEVLNTGGMGILFKARDPKLRRVVAIKALSSTLASVAVARERFLREARAAAKLENGFILPIYEVHEDAVPWFAMRYVEGGTLGDRIDAGEKFDEERLARIGLGIAKALEAANEEGVQHRDIKPENVLLSEDEERLWVCDFGIARCSEDPSLTYPGAIAGTPRYMSPEQAAGSEVDGRSDLFSLGILLYRCATGEHYFRGDTTAAILAEATGGAKDVAAQLNHLPAWLRRLIVHLLEQNPDDRPASASEVVRFIEEKTSPTSRSWNRRSRRRVLTAVAAGTFVLLGGWGSFSFFTRPEIPSIQIGESGPVHRDLAVAVAAAPPGAELYLAGDFRLTEYIKVEKPLSLRSASRKKPTIAVSNSGGHGFFFFAPVELSGIRFVREEATEYIFPLVGISHHQGESLVKDCIFISPANEAKDAGATGLSLSDVLSVTVRNCDFDAGCSMLIGTRRPSAPTTGVVMENCAFSGEIGIEIRQREPNSPGINVTMTRCSAEVDDFISQHHLGPFPKFEFRADDCSIAFRSSCLRVLAADGDTFIDRLRWTGTGNVYSETRTFVQLYEDEGPESVFSDDFKAFIRLPAVDETDSKTASSLDKDHPAYEAFSRR